MRDQGMPSPADSADGRRRQARASSSAQTVRSGACDRPARASCWPGGARRARPRRRCARRREGVFLAWRNRAAGRPRLGRRPTLSTSCTTTPRRPSLPARSGKAEGRQTALAEPSLRPGRAAARAVPGDEPRRPARPAGRRRATDHLAAGQDHIGGPHHVRARCRPKAFSPNARRSPASRRRCRPGSTGTPGRARSCSARRRWISRKRAPPPTTQTLSSRRSRPRGRAARGRASGRPPHGTEPPIAVDAAPRTVDRHPVRAPRRTASATSARSPAGRHHVRHRPLLRNLVNSGPR